MENNAAVPKNFSDDGLDVIEDAELAITKAPKRAVKQTIYHRSKPEIKIKVRSRGRS